MRVQHAASTHTHIYESHDIHTSSVFQVLHTQTMCSILVCLLT